ncbi:MAG: hypothetical protein MK198_09625 [Gracilimonas sp.]|nr:hypothetical protein [Gracilimonas sp.]
MEIEKRKLLVDNPAKVVKDVSDEMIAWKTKGAELYQQLPSDLHDTLKECEPLREESRQPAGPSHSKKYNTWGRQKDSEL